MKAKTFFYLVIFFLIVSVDVTGQLPFDQKGGRYGAMANASLADQSAWQGLSNPAGIYTDNSAWEVGIAYSNRFSLAELGTSHLVLTTSLGSGKVGAVIQSYGYTSYRQNMFSGVYALQLNEQIRVGAQLNYFNVSIAEGYGQFSALTGNIGFQYDFNSDVSVGMVVMNPNRSTLSSEVKEYVSSLIGGGIKYRVAENVLVLSDVSKTLDMDPNFSLGLEYAPVSEWLIRGGISTINRSATFGFGYRSSRWLIDIASAYHQILGFSPMLSITFQNE